MHHDGAAGKAQQFAPTTDGLNVSDGSICEPGNAPESGPLIHARNVVFQAWSV